MARHDTIRTTTRYLSVTIAQLSQLLGAGNETHAAVQVIRRQERDALAPPLPCAAGVKAACVVVVCHAGGEVVPEEGGECGYDGEADGEAEAASHEVVLLRCRLSISPSCDSPRPSPPSPLFASVSGTAPSAAVDDLGNR